MKKSNVLLGLATIFAAGAVAGILLAPDKGERTRRKLARKGRRIYHNVYDKIEEGKFTLEEMRDRLKDDLARINDKIEQFRHN